MNRRRKFIPRTTRVCIRSHTPKNDVAFVSLGVCSSIMRSCVEALTSTSGMISSEVAARGAAVARYRLATRKAKGLCVFACFTCSQCIHLLCSCVCFSRAWSVCGFTCTHSLFLCVRFVHTRFARVCDFAGAHCFTFVSRVHVSACVCVSRVHTVHSLVWVLKVCTHCTFASVGV